jgi:tripartite-type tricarboxylate transporter receptor subunit TctC
MLELVVRNPPFKITDRTFLGTVGEGSMMLIVPGTSPYKSVAELAAAWKANPAGLTWASAGGNSALDLGARRLAHAAGITITQTRPINHRGGSEVTTRIAGGHVDFGFGSWTTVSSYHASGTVRVLAVSSEKRLPQLPDVPTTGEAGFPTVLVFNWIGLSGPANMPPAVVAKWETALKAMSEDPAVLQKLANIGVVPFYNNGEKTRQMIINDQKVVTDLWPELSK